MFKDITHITIPQEFHRLSDIYIPHDKWQDGILFPGAVSIESCPAMFDIMQCIYDECKQVKDVDFAMQFIHENKKIMFRGHIIDTLEGRIYDLRRLSQNVPDMHKLGYKENYTELLISEKLNAGGLVLLCGETGQGKSTTASSAILYRMKKYGAFCLTIEDPIEMPMQGIYIGEDGKRGVCYQTQVKEEQIEEAIKGSLRSYPSVSNSMLFLGETRSSAMAYEVLKIAANGHLVFTTLHGFDLISSLERFVQMASSHKNTKKEEVMSMFSLVFRLAIHQRLSPPINGVRKLDAKILFSSSSISSVANRIKGGNIGLLSTDIEQQNMMLKSGKSILNQ